MTRPPARLLALVFFAVLIGSCRKTDAPRDPIDPTGPVSLSVPISPVLLPSPANDGAAPVDRLEVTIVTLPDSALLGTITASATPGSTDWDVNVTGSTEATSLQVAVTVSLISTSGGTPTVQFSGFVSPVSISASGTIAPIEIPLVRGPLANVFATGVTVDLAPDSVDIDESGSIAGSATTSGSVPPTVFWTVLDTTILELDGDTTVTGRAAGTTQLIASAGRFSDTTSVVVRGRPVSLRVTKSVDDPAPLPDSTVTFSVTVANDGTFDATGIRVLDILDPVFESPVFVTSIGALEGDTLWTIDSIAPGDSATWTTTATVAPSAGGGSASNSAILVAVEQNDTTPANDTATVAMEFPVSALPVVTISAPADSAVYDPGDAITFTGTASDLEDGDLTGSIAWTSSLDGEIGTGGSVVTSQLRTGVHRIVAGVVDSDGGASADTITVTVALYSVPLTLNVPFSGTASMPITLSEPAPTGGVTLTVAAVDPSITTPTVSSIFIMEGAQSSNATLQGLSPGTTTVRVSNAQFGVVTSEVTVTAELDILGPAITMAPAFIESITIQFESLGTPIAAPENGLDVTLTARDPTCVSVASTVTIPGGLTNETAEVTYGGSASLTCATYVVASAPSIVSDSVLVSVIAAPTISVGTRTVGWGLQTGHNATLPLGNHGGVTVTVTSSDPSTLLISPDANTPGTASIEVAVADGGRTVPFYVQGVEDATGTPTVTLTAAGFTDGSNTVSVVQPGLVLSGAPTNTTTLSNNSNLYAQIGIPYSSNTVTVQQVRAGGTPVTVTFTSSDVGVGTLTDGQTSGATFDRTIDVGQYFTPTTVGAGGIAFDPIGSGTVTLTADATAQNVLMRPNATRTVTVTTGS